MKYTAQIETTVAGIPCIVGVTEYTAGDGRADSSDDYYGYSEWRVCDRKGCPAPWLEVKLTRADQARIESEINHHFN
tara:strand:- start:1175 stop:1405 length:231 start_codon:yes stop_codon:yes gene_type:complete